MKITEKFYNDLQKILIAETVDVKSVNKAAKAFADWIFDSQARLGTTDPDKSFKEKAKTAKIETLKKDEIQVDKTTFTSDEMVAFSYEFKGGIKYRLLTGADKFKNVKEDAVGVLVVPVDLYYSKQVGKYMFNMKMRSKW